MQRQRRGRYIVLPGNNCAPRLRTAEQRKGLAIKCSAVETNAEAEAEPQRQSRGEAYY